MRINQASHPDKGRYFIVEVNGRKIFLKGGNFVPVDMIFPRADRKRYDKVTDLALEANFNIRRLAPHPSLVVWCGNNELEWGAWGWGYDRGVVYPDYALFHLTLPRLLAEEDPGRFYQPSSPYSPDGLFPNADEAGDQHPWTIGFANTDFREYRKMFCRFPNEGGILGPTSLPTMLACLPKDQRYVQSFAWKKPLASAAFALLGNCDGVVARNRLFLPLFKELKWAKPQLKVRVSGGEAIFTSNTFMWGVCLGLDGTSLMPDNFFDVYPGIPHVIPWKSRRKPQVRFVGNSMKD